MHSRKSRTNEIRFIAVLGMLLLWPWCLQGAETVGGKPMRWVVGIEKDIHPISHGDADGKASGYVVDLLDAISKEEGIKLEYVTDSWSKLYKAFLEGHVDVLGAAAYTHDRIGDMMYSEPHLSASPVLFVRDGITISSPSQMRSLRIVTMPGSRSYEYLKSRGYDRQFRYSDSTEEALKMLERGEADGLIDSAMVGAQLVAQLGLKKVKISDIVLPEMSLNLHFAVRPGDVARLDILNSGLEKAVRSGAVADLRERWMGPFEKRDFDWTKIRPYLVFGGLLFLTVVGAVFWQQRLLRRLRASEAALKRSSAMLKQAQGVASIGGWEIDRLLGTITISDEVYQLLDLDPHAFRPSIEALLGLFPPSEQTKLREGVFCVESTGEPKEIEITAITPKGRSVIVRCIGHPEMQNGKVVKLYGSIQDVTATKTAETERAELQRKLLETQRLESLGVMAGGIAHDFNNLLTVILTNASFLKGDPNLRSDGIGSVEQIELAARRAAELCKQMHAYSGRATMDHRRIDLRQLFREINALLTLTAGKRTKLTLQLPDGLPSILGDPTQLRQVVLNLVQNAAEAINHPDGAILVSLEPIIVDSAKANALRPTYDLTPGDFVRLCVKDNGCGIPPDTMKHLFEPFFTTKFAGRGLGLAAVHGIARAHKGAIEVTTVVGSGSSFAVLLPVSHHAAIQTPERRKTEGVVSVPSKPENALLLADDDQPIRRTLSMLLRRRGHDVLEASDGQQAIQLFKAEPERIRAAILDITMPEKSGIEVLHEIRLAKPDLPVLLISGYSLEDYAKTLQGQTALSFLSKPFTHEDFLGRLRALLGSSPDGTSD